LSDPKFDAFAEDYARHAAGSPYNALYDRPAVLSLLGDVRGQRVLDAGCGPGFYAEKLVEQGAEVVAFDQGPGMVRLARERVGERAAFRVHDLADPLDWLQDAGFDAIVLALVIHHVDDLVAALKELHRVLRPGGRMVVSTHHPVSDWLRRGGSYFDARVVEEVWNRGWQVRYWQLPLTTICEEFSAAGFVIERLVEPLPVPEMADRYPDDYAKLMREPGFVNFLLRKSGPE
jgi:SAM-dependent methyltransferase